MQKPSWPRLTIEAGPSRRSMLPRIPQLAVFRLYGACDTPVPSVLIDNNVLDEASRFFFGKNICPRHSELRVLGNGIGVSSHTSCQEQSKRW